MGVFAFDDQSVADIPVPTHCERVSHWDKNTVGFGIEVTRAGSRTFIARRRVNGKLIKKRIGAIGEQRMAGDRTGWNVSSARAEALRVMDAMASVADPDNSFQVIGARFRPTGIDGLQQINNRNGTTSWRARIVVDGKRVGRTFPTKEAALAELDKQRSRISESTAPIVAFKIYAAHSDGTESLVFQDGLPSGEERTHEFEARGETWGMWMCRLPDREPTDDEVRFKDKRREGKLVLIDRNTKAINGVFWNCHCDCGWEGSVPNVQIKNGYAWACQTCVKAAGFARKSEAIRLGFCPADEAPLPAAKRQRLRTPTEAPF